jgi:O-succinylbenzoate synthase
LALSSPEALSRIPAADAGPVAVEVLRLRASMAPRHASWGTVASRDILVVVAEVGGARGVGECPSFPAPYYGPSWYGADLAALELVCGMLDEAPLTVGDLVRVLDRIKGCGPAKAGLEAALLDAGFRLEGASGRELLGAHAELAGLSCSVAAHGPPELVLAGIGERLEAGYARIKLKIGPRFDPRLVGTVRERYPELDLAIDANGSFSSLREAVELLVQLEGLSLSFLEQPFSELELEATRRLQDFVSIPVCLDESISSEASIRLAACLGAGSVFSLKPPRLGGIRATLACLRTVKELGYRCFVGGTHDGSVGRAILSILAARSEVTDPSEIVAPPFGPDDGLGEAGSWPAYRGPGLLPDEAVELVRRTGEVVVSGGARWGQRGMSA